MVIIFTILFITFSPYQIFKTLKQFPESMNEVTKRSMAISTTGVITVKMLSFTAVIFFFIKFTIFVAKKAQTISQKTDIRKM